MAGKLWDGEHGLIAQLLRGEQEWTSFIGKQYVLKGQDKRSGALVYGWCISITSENLPRAVENFCGLIYEFIGAMLGQPARSEEKLEVIHLDEGTETIIPIRSSASRNTPSATENGIGLGGATPIRR